MSAQAQCASDSPLPDLLPVTEFGFIDYMSICVTLSGLLADITLFFLFALLKIMAAGLNSNE